MDEEDEHKPKSSGCESVTFLISWLLLVLTTALSVACTWAYNKNYDDSSSGFSGIAAYMTSIALFGSTLGLCTCCPCGGGMKMGIGFLLNCFHACDDMDNLLCMLCRIGAACGLVLIAVFIIAPSFGIWQLISGGLVARSIVLNTATNVKVFGGFIAAFDFFATICGLIFGYLGCKSIANGDCDDCK